MYTINCTIQYRYLYAYFAYLHMFCSHWQMNCELILVISLN